MWFAGDNVTLSGTDLTQWNDKSGNGLNLTKESQFPSNYAQFVASDSNFNDKPTLTFVWGGIYEVAGQDMSAFMTSEKEFQWFWVGMQTNTGSYKYALGDDSGYCWFGMTTSGTYYGYDTHVEVAVAASTPQMFQLVNGQDGTGNLVLYASNGQLDDYGSQVDYYPDDWFDRNIIQVGGRSSGGFEGTMAEILCYASPIVDDDLTQTKCYLSGKYDIEWE